jgi:hypothetical protein
MSWATHLELDPNRHVATRYQGFAGSKIAAFGEVVIPWGDPAGHRAAALFERFVDLARAAVQGDEVHRHAIAKAARTAMDADVELATSQKGYFTFVVAINEKGGTWSAHALGPYFVLHIADAGYRELMLPESGASDLVAQGIPRARALELAGTTTKAVIPVVDFEHHVRSAKVEMRPREWLLIMPESSGIGDLVLDRQPENLTDIRAIVGVLVPPQLTVNRSWLAIRGAPPP